MAVVLVLPGKHSHSHLLGIHVLLTADQFVLGIDNVILGGKDGILSPGAVKLRLQGLYLLTREEFWLFYKRRK